MEDIFWVAYTSDIYLGCLKFIIFLFLFLLLFFFLGGGGGVNSRCWTRAYICRKNESTPPLGFVHQFTAYKWAFVPVGFCPSGLLSSGLLS